MKQDSTDGDLTKIKYKPAVYDRWYDTASRVWFYDVYCVQDTRRKKKQPRHKWEVILYRKFEPDDFYCEAVKQINDGAGNLITDKLIQLRDEHIKKHGY